MIVNTAYPFMAKTKKLFTHLFENGKSNYPTDFAANVVLNEAGLIIPENGVKAAFLEIPLSKFRTLNFSGHGAKYSSSRVQIAIQKPTGGKAVSTFLYSLNSSSQGGSTYSYQIPSNARIDGYTIAFISDGSGAATIIDAVFDV
jgi:hypothetical protein